MRRRRRRSFRRRRSYGRRSKRVSPPRNPRVGFRM